MVNKSGQWPVCSGFLLFRTDFSPKHTHTHVHSSPKRQSVRDLNCFAVSSFFAFCILFAKSQKIGITIHQAAYCSFHTSEC